MRLCTPSDRWRADDAGAGIDFACGAPQLDPRSRKCNGTRLSRRPLATMRPRARAVRGGVKSEARSPPLRISPAHVLKSYRDPSVGSPCSGVRGGVFFANV